MRKPLLHVLAFLPVIFLSAFYVARIAFHMRDAAVFGIVMIVGGAFLSFLTPFLLTLILLTTETRYKLHLHFVSCGLAAGLYWTLCFLDLGKQLHRFIAA
jgi:hypothetical protein